MSALGRQFDPHALAYGEEVTVDAEEFAAHPAIRRNERDPKHGGRASVVHDNVMDEVAPGHGQPLKYGDLSRDEVRARSDQRYKISTRYRQEHGEDFRTDPEKKASFLAEYQAPDVSTGSLTGDQYIEGIGNSMAAVGQKEPGILFSEEGGGFWLGEGNHRLAAARRTGQPYRVKRRDKG